MTNKERILEIIERINSNKRELKTLRESVKSTCEQSGDYKQHREMKDESTRKMKAIELALSDPNDLARIDNLKADIKNDKQVITDIALTEMMGGNSIELEDDEGNVYQPSIKISFQMQLL